MTALLTADEIDELSKRLALWVRGDRTAVTAADVTRLMDDLYELRGRVASARLMLEGRAGPVGHTP